MTALASSQRPPAAAAIVDDDDGDLLCRYVRDGSQEAFTRLVERHVAMVYGTARRSLGRDNAADAEDVAQAVFILLARKAATIRPNTSLASWLYNATRMTAANARRGTARRRRHEHGAGESMRQHLAAASSSGSFSSSSADASLTWAEIEPVLDDAMSRLRPHDREALVLRFLAARSLREVGDAIGISEDAARVRVNRALSRLRRLLGVTAPAIALTTALEAGAAQAAAAAPAHLASTIAASALAPIAGSSSAALASATAATAAAPTGLKVAIFAIAAVLITGAGTAGVVLVKRQMAPPAPRLMNVGVDAAAGPASSEAAATFEFTAVTPTTVPSNTPRGVTLSILRAATAGDRAALRALMHIDNDDEQRAADAGIESLVAEARLDAVAAAKFPGARGVTRTGDKFAVIAASKEVITADRASLVMPNSPVSHVFVRVGGQWKLVPSIAVLEGDPPAMLDRRIAQLKEMTAALDLTAAEIEVGHYPTRTVAMETLAKRLQAIFPPTTQPAAAAAAPTTGATIAPTTRVAPSASR